MRSVAILVIEWHFTLHFRHLWIVSNPSYICNRLGKDLVKLLRVYENNYSCSLSSATTCDNKIMILCVPSSVVQARDLNCLESRNRLQRRKFDAAIEKLFSVTGIVSYFDSLRTYFFGIDVYFHVAVLKQLIHKLDVDLFIYRKQKTI